MPTSSKAVPDVGGLPSPENLRKYNELDPSFAGRLIAAFERQQVHRLELEVKAQEAQIADTRRGQVFGLIIGITAVVGGTLSSIFGSGWAGAFIGGGGVVGLVSVFVAGRVIKQRGRDTPTTSP